MKDFETLSGPWVGNSVQDGLRISETMHLSISGGLIRGEGSDMDGRFDLIGNYTSGGAKVEITRTYNWVAIPNPEGVGVPYLYRGKWDGMMVSGRWCPRSDPWYGGSFEMWPSREEDILELQIQIETLVMDR